MKNKISREKISYWFDNIMSKGPITMSLLLFAIMMTAVIIIGVLAFLVSGDDLIKHLWVGLMHTLDPGVLSGTSTNNLPYIILMTIATILGMLLTSVLIGIIATGVESKLRDLRKGTSIVQEEDHTTIIGFNSNVYDILRELIEANSNKKRACIVILGDLPKDEMDDAVNSHIADTKTTKIICRSGNLHETYALERCAIENSRSVIINVHDDAETVKIVLALSTYLKGKKIKHPELQFVASIQDNQFMEAARIAGEGRLEIIYSKDAIARIIANTCRQHGLSQVLTELFDFDGDELYFESVAETEGKTFKEALLYFSNATLVGLYSDGNVQLNPPMDTIIKKGDQLILIESDDGEYIVQNSYTIDESKITNNKNKAIAENNNLIVLGSNNKLPIILAEYDKYVLSNTRIVIVDDDMNLDMLGNYNNLKIEICTKPITRKLLCDFLNENLSNLLLLNDDSQDSESSDSQTLLRLILLRDIADKTNRHLAITTEMRSVNNQQLASQARVDDFVVGSNLSSLLMAQISENSHLSPLITELLDEDGSELYMKPASNYVVIGEPVNSYILTESAARNGEIYIGYRHINTNDGAVVVNPNKEETLVFEEQDLIVVVAED